MSAYARKYVRKFIMCLNTHTYIYLHTCIYIYIFGRGEIGISHQLEIKLTIHGHGEVGPVPVRPWLFSVEVVDQCIADRHPASVFNSWLGMVRMYSHWQIEIEVRKYPSTHPRPFSSCTSYISYIPYLCWLQQVRSKFFLCKLPHFWWSSKVSWLVDSIASLHSCLERSSVNSFCSLRRSWPVAGDVFQGSWNRKQ